MDMIGRDVEERGWKGFDDGITNGDGGLEMGAFIYTLLETSNGILRWGRTTSPVNRDQLMLNTYCDKGVFLVLGLSTSFLRH